MSSAVLFPDGRNNSLLSGLNPFDQDAFLDKIIALPEDRAELKVCLWWEYIKLFHLNKDDLTELFNCIHYLVSVTHDESVNLKFYDQLLQDNRNTQFYTQYLELLVQTASTDRLLTIFHSALTDTEYDFINSHKVSNLYISFLQSQKDIKSIRDHYFKRLSIPHQNIDETFQSFFAFTKSSFLDTSDSEVANASKIYNKTKKDQYDLELLYVRKQEQSTEQYWTEILETVSSVPKKRRNIYAVIPVFENALLASNTQDIWKNFILILYQYEAHQEVETYLSRFIKNFPSSATPYIEYLRNIGEFPNSTQLYSTITPRVEYLVSKGLDFESWKDLVITQSSFLLNQLKLGNEEFKELFAVLSKQCFEKSLATEDNTFHSVERFIVNAHEGLGEIETARVLLKRLTQAYPTESEGWLISYYFERRNAPDYQNASKILRAAVNVSEALDWPERIFEEATRFAELNGDVSLYRSLKVRTEDKKRIVTEARASQQEQYDEIEEQVESNKRKVEEDADLLHEGTKRVKVDNHRDRENLTIAVRHIPSTISEKQIRSLFKDCGPINELHIVSLGDLQQANIEFTNEQDFLKALTKDYKRLGGKEIRVEKLISTIWVANFPPDYTKEKLESLFSSYGTIVSVRLPSLAFNSQRRFCYIEFATAEESLTAVTALDGQVIDDFKFTVKISDPSSRKNRSGAAEEGRELYVSKLDFFKVDSNRVKQLFSKYGTVENVHLPLSDRNKIQGKKHDGYGFVVFKTAEEAQAALELNLVTFEGRVIEVSVSEKKAQRVQKKEVQAIRDFSRSDNVVAIRNLPDTINAQQLKLFFSNFGEVSSVILESDFHGAIIEYQEQKDAAKASLSANGQSFQGYNVQVTTVNELRRGENVSAKRKVGLVPSSIRRQVASLDISKPSSTSNIESNTISAAPKSNADFRKMFLGGK